VRNQLKLLVTKGKSGTLHARRIVAAFLNNKKAVNKLVDEISPKFKDRHGGFTRIIRLGRRQGDDAMMVKLELIEKPETEEKPAPKKGEKKKDEKNKGDQSK